MEGMRGSVLPGITRYHYRYRDLDHYRQNRLYLIRLTRLTRLTPALVLVLVIRYYQLWALLNKWLVFLTVDHLILLKRSAVHGEFLRPYLMVSCVRFVLIFFLNLFEILMRLLYFRLEPKDQGSHFFVIKM